MKSGGVAPNELAAVVAAVLLVADDLVSLTLGTKALNAFLLLLLVVVVVLWEGEAEGASLSAFSVVGSGSGPKA